MSNLTPDAHDRDYRGSVEVQQKLASVAQTIRLAITELTECIDATEPDSDVETRCQEALEGLEAAIYHVEWTPPRDKDTH